MGCTNEQSMSIAAKLLGKQNRKACILLNLANYLLTEKDSRKNIIGSENTIRKHFRMYFSITCPLCSIIFDGNSG